MSEFNTAIDIANRACQHVGVTMIDAALGFTEDSKQSNQIGFAYGKLRRAELRRNIWTFATRRAVLRPLDDNTMLFGPSLWVASTTYYRGSIVADDNGHLWISRLAGAGNTGNDPQNSPFSWEPYFGPLSVSLYDDATTYFAGELVYTTAGDGLNRVYLSLQSGNADNPATPTDWDATVTYFRGQTVTRSSVAYQSLIDLNINNDPAIPAPLWDVTTSYGIGDHVAGSDGVLYVSLIAANLGIDPVADVSRASWQNTGTLAPWTATFVGGAGSLKWLQVGGAEFPSGVVLYKPNIVYPIGAGPSSQSGTRNVFHKPANFLRLAPQDPKAGSFSYLGAPTNRLADDWNFEGDYLTSAFADAIPLRFVADLVNVTEMDDLFCEGLAARIALEVCEPITQSNTKLAAIAQAYQKFMSEARTINAIEQGWVEPPLDDYLACRL